MTNQVLRKEDSRIGSVLNTVGFSLFWLRWKKKTNQVLRKEDSRIGSVLNTVGFSLFWLRWKKKNKKQKKNGKTWRTKVRILTWL